MPNTQCHNAIMFEVCTRICEYLSRGFSLAESYDKVFGDGAYQKLKSDVYDEINSKEKPCKP